MRGFGANQVAFALESCIDELCEKGGFDRWKFRYDNALENGKMTATGQVLGKGVGYQSLPAGIEGTFLCCEICRACLRDQKFRSRKWDDRFL